MNDKIIYQLAIDDLQKVSMKIIKRILTQDEIETISKMISDSIDWYDIISTVIGKNFE